jgi:Methyltransferase domain
MKSTTSSTSKHDPRPDQSVPLLKALHILTREGKLNQDSRRKLKQVNHLMQFIKPLIESVAARKSEGDDEVVLVDHGAGKSYLGFMVYDSFFKPVAGQARAKGKIIGVETREALVRSSTQLAREFGFESGMSFLNLSVQAATDSQALPKRIDIVTALHACDTATDDAIQFALRYSAEHVVLVPCCQAEVATSFREDKVKSQSYPAPSAGASVLNELWRHPLHAREFGSQLTNVLRALQLEAHGYQVTVTELVGWEHSMKNELIIASKKSNVKSARQAREKLDGLMSTLGLNALRPRFFSSLQTADE